MDDERLQILIQARDEATATIKRVETELRQLGGSALPAVGTGAQGAAGGLDALGTSGNFLRGVLTALIPAISVGTVVALARMGAQFDEQRESLDFFAQKAGVDADAIVAAMDKGAGGTIPQMELIGLAAKSMTADVKLSTEQYTQLMQIAKSRAQAFGISTATAFSQMSMAIDMGYTRGLRYIRMRVDAATAEEEYARSINKSREDLNEAERSQAIANAILKEGAQDVARMAGATDSAADKMDKFDASMKNAALTAGRELAPSLGLLAGMGSAVVDEWAKGFAGLDKIIRLVAAGAASITTWESAIMKGLGFEEAERLSKAIARNVLLPPTSKEPAGFNETRFLAGRQTSAARQGTTPSPAMSPDDRTKIEKGLLSAQESYKSYYKQVGELDARHSKSMIKLAEDETKAKATAIKDALKAQTTASGDILKVEADARQRMADLEHSFNESRAEAERGYLKQIQDAAREAESIEKDRQTSILDLNKNTAKKLEDLNKDAAKKLDDLNRNALKKISDLSSGAADDEANAKTWAEVVGIRERTTKRRQELEDERKAQAAAIETARSERIAGIEEERKARSEEIAATAAERKVEHGRRLQEITTEYEYNRSTAQREFDEDRARLQSETEARRQEIATQLAESLAAIDERRTEELDAITKRKEEEIALWNDSKTAAKDALNEQITKAFVLQSQAELLRNAWWKVGNQLDENARKMLYQSGIMRQMLGDISALPGAVQYVINKMLSMWEYSG